MSDDRSMERPRFTARDDSFHFDLLGDRWWATETAWFSFSDLERGLGGWLYTMVRPNIGTVAGGAWVWDATAHLPWEVLYSTNYSALELPAGADLADITLPTGTSIQVIEPTTSYRLGYHDGDRLRVDLRFDGVMAPEPLVSKRSTFGRAAHFDQFGRVTGEIEVHGERIEIDCIAMRDRSWGRRPEDRPRRSAYVTGAAGPDDHFLAVTNVVDDQEHIAYGFVRRDGVLAAVVEGTRVVEREPRHGWITGITIRATDERGRRLVATGTPVSRIVLNRHSFIDVNSLIRWEIDGLAGVGEDQDMWPVHEWADAARARRASSGGGGDGG